ncbi:GES-1 protein [Aphelenchoides avenae]|nr:GES-1 protein [Aphelenchus avenae]
MSNRWLTPNTEQLAGEPLRRSTASISLFSSEFRLLKRQLAFEKPQPPLPWSGTLEANEYPPACIPLVRSRHRADANEDLHPVMVIIHLGGFATGSAMLYGDYDDIAANFVSKGIVVVVIQYRLGVHGFASTGNSVLPGNFGLWDQVAALKFIKANIREFGGDPDRITLFGYSAGAASVSALSASPSSRDLFAQSIQMSGSSVADWVISGQAAKETAKLLELIGCKDRADLSAKECLKKTPNEDIAVALEKMKVGERLPQYRRLRSED